ncbi:hypothetical protein GCM10011608_19600 [Micromonospora sonchi]|uniref:Uncharacterized protein n=1 Tax=Micromonospora sonchi TaxID=1763543 RepID=A0A917TS64_9ACTN|nr:hypothetical protein [Micromonospora sonchi]GGM35067.1 hypothetical protein GCM10011608_19600 [Micromonospora sonchi]
MALIAEGADALDVQGCEIFEVARICDGDGLLEAVQLVFSDGRSLTLTVWTDWSLAIELRSDVVVPEYLWPPEERVRIVIAELSDLSLEVGQAVPRFNDAAEIVEVRFVLSGRKLLVGSTGGNLIIKIE